MSGDAGAGNGRHSTTTVLLDVRPVVDGASAIYGIPRYVRALATALPAMDRRRRYSYLSFPERVKRWQAIQPSGLPDRRAMQ